MTVIGTLETRAKRLVRFDEAPVKKPTPYGKRYTWAATAVIELQDGREVTYQVTADTREKLAQRIARAKQRCAGGITGMSLNRMLDGVEVWVVDVFGGTWI